VVTAGEFCDPETQVPHCGHFSCVPIDFGVSVFPDPVDQVDLAKSMDGFLIAWETAHSQNLIPSISYRYYGAEGPSSETTQVIAKSTLVQRAWDIDGSASTPAVLIYAASDSSDSTALTRLNLRTLGQANEVELGTWNEETDGDELVDVHAKVIGNSTAGHIISVWTISNSISGSSQLYRAIHPYSCSAQGCVPVGPLAPPEMIHEKTFGDVDHPVQIKNISVTSRTKGEGDGSLEFEAWVAFSYGLNLDIMAFNGATLSELNALRGIYVLNLGAETTTVTDPTPLFLSEVTNGSSNMAHPVLVCDGVGSDACLIAAVRKQDAPTLLAMRGTPPGFLDAGSVLEVGPEGPLGNNSLVSLISSAGARRAEGTCGYMLGWTHRHNEKGRSYLGRLGCQENNELEFLGVRLISPELNESTARIQVICGGVEAEQDFCASVFLGYNLTQLRAYLFPPGWVP
jgi:hypothetical protein